jgi:hypothetical protein
MDREGIGLESSGRRADVMFELIAYALILRGVGPQDVNGNIAIVLSIASGVHLPEAGETYALDNLEWTQSCADHGVSVRNWSPAVNSPPRPAWPEVPASQATRITETTYLGAEPLDIPPNR